MDTTRLERVFLTYSQGSYSVQKDRLEQQIGQALPCFGPLVTMPEFTQYVQKQFNAACHKLDTLTQQVNSLRREQQQRAEAYENALVSEEYTNDGLSVNSHFEIVVIQATGLGPEQSLQFAVLLGNEPVFKSSPCDAQHVWNCRVSVPIARPGVELSVQLHNKREILTTYALDLTQFYNQCWQSLWVPVGKGELSIMGQWVHDGVKFRELALRNCETLLTHKLEEAEHFRTLVNHLNVSDYVELVRNWLPEPPTYRAKRRVFAKTDLNLGDLTIDNELSKASTYLAQPDPPPTRGSNDCFAVGVFRGVFLNQMN